MAVETATAIEFISSFSMMGSIKKFESFDTKGGGIALKMETADLDHLIDISNAKGNVCRITIEVSKQKNVEGGEDDPDQLDFDSLDGDEA